MNLWKEKRLGSICRERRKVESDYKSCNYKFQDLDLWDGGGWLFTPVGCSLQLVDHG